MFEARGIADVSRNASEPDSASLHELRVASLPEMVKPAPIVKRRAHAAIGLSGVIEDGGRRQISQEPGRPIIVSGKSRQAAWGINNPASCDDWESDRLIVAMKRGNARGAKGSERKTC